MNKIRLYIPPLILGFVIVPLLVYWRWLRWLLVLSRWVLWEKYCSLSRSCSGVFHFWNSNLGYWLNMHFFFCAMCCVGWQFSCRAQSELKSRLHCWLVFAPVYFWLLLWNIIFYVAPAQIALLENMRNFFLTIVWLPLNFFNLGLSRGLTLSVR